MRLLSTLTSRIAKPLVAVAVVAAACGAAYLVQAQSSGAPAATVQVGDDGGCSSVGAVRTATPSSGMNWTQLVGDGGNNKDFNCMKVGIPGAAITQDFRFGIQLSDDEGCSGNQITSASWTPWASQGGGWGPRTTGDDFDNQNCARIAIQTRPLPGGLQIQNAQLGVQLDNGSQAWSPWSAAGGGMSGWAVKTDVHWAMAGLRVELFDPSTLDAAFVATTIPGVASPSTTYDNVSVTMQNTGTGTWYSSQEIPGTRTNECDYWDIGNPPEQNGATCTFTKKVFSPAKKLIRLDDVSEIELLDPRAAGSPVTRELRYERQVQVTYRSVMRTARSCNETGNPNALGPVMRFLSRIPLFGARVAHALPDPTQTCTTVTFYVTQVTETPDPDVDTGANATFPFKLRTSVPGEYDLRFRMADVVQNPDFPFGEEKTIHVSVPGDSGLGLQCQAPVQTVLAGGTAPYPLTVSAQNTTAPSPVTLSVTAGLPEGASAAPREVTVPPNGSASAVMSVVTAPQTPVGTSTLTFSASSPGMATSSCTSLLVVRPNTSGEPTVTVTPSLWEVPVGGTAIYQAWYDPDGFAGPATSTPVTAESAWAVRTGQIATVTGAGTFVGAFPGQTRITATYDGREGSADLRVMMDGRTLRVSPPSRQVGVGETAVYQAWYDPDGGGSAEEFEVSGVASWSIGSAVATSQGGGSFVAATPGSGTVNASYNGLSAMAVLDVTGSGPTLRVTPTSRSIDVDGVAEFSATYDPDGTGPAQGTDVTASAAWSTDRTRVVRSQGNGRFLGLSEGNASAIAVYNGLSDAGAIRVGDDEEPRLRVEPDLRETLVGGQVSFDAYYDPDGNGGQAEQFVTGAAAWSSLGSGARSDGGGLFTGLAEGDTTVRASYSGVSDEALVRIAAPVPGQCSFAASPGTLFIPPPKSTTLSWSCGQPTTCTVSRVTGGVQTLATGGQSGSVPHSPPHTTTYNLTCANGTNQNLQVRVFNVRTRIEILPQ